MSKKIESLTKELLSEIGEDPSSEGLIATPHRVAKSFEFLTAGYHQDAGKILSQAIFKEKYDEMVIIRDIEIFSLCEHHLLPFFGQCHVGYLPKGKLVGISKIPRIVDVFSRRLQIQERLTTEIAESLWQHLNPHGVAVVLEARHLCMMMRGVEKQNSLMTTSAMLGVFKTDRSTRMEFMDLIKKRG